MVKGKFVFCERGVVAKVEKGVSVKEVDGVGMILANTAQNRDELSADSHLIRSSIVGKDAGDKINNYIKSVTLPTA